MTHLFLALAGLLSSGDALVTDAVRAAIEQPASYVQAHAETTERFASAEEAAADPVLPWLALVDALLARQLAVELDWSTEHEEVLASLERLGNFRGVSDLSRRTLQSLQREDAATIGWLRDIAEVVEADKLVVAAMDIDSDSYVVLLLPAPVYVQASQHAGQLGFLLRDVREHDPNA